MNRRNKEEDSGSDWDSMSEIGPPPSSKQVPHSSGPPSQSLPPIQSRERTAPHVAPQVDILPTKENPPYNFRAEVRSPLHVSEPLPKPGKQRKGKLYDPQSGPQKHVTFGDQVTGHGQRTGVGGMTNPDSDSEDPLYSTVKPKNRAKGNNQQSVSAELEKNEAVNKPKKAARNSTKLSQKPVEGIDNHGYIEDQILPTGAITVSGDVSKSTHVSVPHANSPQMTHKMPLPSFSESYFDSMKASKSRDSHRIMENNIPAAKECPPPLILTAGEALLESAGRKPVEAANRALREAFALITLPFTCFTLFLHHLLRFILQGVLRPLFVDSLRLVIEYLVQPFITGVMKPLMVTVHVASLSLSETMLVCVRPLTAVLQSVRLVEVHYTSRYSVEEI